MKTNLSSQIKLDRIPKRYYAPDGELELAALTRDEKVYTKIFEGSEEGSVYVAHDVAELIQKCKAEHRHCVLALGSGVGTHAVYAELVRMYQAGEVSFSNVIVFNIGEYYPLAEGAPGTMSLLKELLLDKVNIDPENIHSPGKLVSKEDVYQYCKNYEEEIEACGGIDLALCEIGAVGNLAFNEPGSQLNSSCRLMLLGSDARHMASSQFNSSENVPRSAVTLGISNLMSARRIVCVAWGENKANIVKRTIEGDITDLIPSSFLQTHRRAKIVLDLSAAEALTRISRPWLVTSCEWDEKLIRRAIVWLCKVTGKPILKLTDKDYNDNGLSELVALFGSAYNVNIRIFNSLQHTITGWPGGKPNADDTFRPERAKPYPKRVIVFSPHPDDDVIRWAAHSNDWPTRSTMYTWHTKLRVISPWVTKI